LSFVKIDVHDPWKAKWRINGKLPVSFVAGQLNASGQVSQLLFAAQFGEFKGSHTPAYKNMHKITLLSSVLYIATS
jgi:hypothetical protein